MATKPKRPYTIVRGGKLLDIAKRKAAPADILIKGDTIAEIGRPGLAAPAGASVIDARHRLMHPGLINAHTHGPGNLGKGMGDLLVARAAADGQPVDQQRPHARGQVPVEPDRRRPRW